MSIKSIVKILIIFLIVAVTGTACFLKYQGQQEAKLKAEYNNSFKSGMLAFNQGDFNQSMNDFSTAETFIKTKEAHDMSVECSNGLVEQMQINAIASYNQEKNYNGALTELKLVKQNVAPLQIELNKVTNVAKEGMLNQYVQMARNFIGQQELVSASNVATAMSKIDANSQQYKEVMKMIQASQDNNSKLASINLVQSIINKL